MGTKTAMEAVYEQNKAFINACERNIPIFVKLQNDRRREFDEFQKRWFEYFIAVEKNMIGMGTNFVPYIEQFGWFANALANEYTRMYREYSKLRPTFSFNPKNKEA